LNHHKTSILSKTIKQNYNYIRTTENVIESLELKKQILDASFVGEHVPVEFTNFVRCFFDDAKKIEEYWKLVVISAGKNKVSEQIVETAISSFKILIRKYKFSKVQSVYGFYFGILNRKFKALFLRDTFNDWWNYKDIIQ